MHQRILYLIFCTGLILLALGCARQETTEVAPALPAPAAPSESESAAIESNTLMAAKLKPKTKKKIAPLFLDFKKTDYEAAASSGKLVVLYFYADWCPICKKEFPVMQETFKELNTDKVIGFRVNYNDDFVDDDERALARKFGVAYQHTKVFVKNNKRLLKAPDGWNKNRYTTEIAKYL